MLEDVELPDGLALVRTTEAFTAETVPAGLRRAHRIAEGVWGRLEVRAGTVAFVLEATGESRTVHAGEAQVIEPGVRHHVEPDADATFAISFHRPAAEVADDDPPRGAPTEI